MKNEKSKCCGAEVIERHNIGYSWFECSKCKKESNSPHPTSNEECNCKVPSGFPCKHNYIETPTSNEKIEVITSPRIDYCCKCGKEHGFVCPLDVKCLCHTSNESWREELQIEVMENYLMDAEMSPGELKNQYMREHFEKLISFISQTLQKERKAERERIIKRIEELRRTYIIPPRELVKSRNRRDIRITQVKYFNYNKALDDIINLLTNQKE